MKLNIYDSNDLAFDIDQEQMKTVVKMSSIENSFSQIDLEKSGRVLWI